MAKRKEKSIVRKPAPLNAPGRDDDQPRERRTLLVARAGTRLIGVFEDETLGVSDWLEPVPLPRAPLAVLGVVSIRGRMTTTLDLAPVFGDDSAAVVGEHRVLIALRGDEQLALAVNGLQPSIEINLDEIEHTDDGSGVWRGLIRHGDEAIAILDPEELFAAAMRGGERRRQRN
jgi:purine-binding chemotaxis protein CheW